MRPRPGAARMYPETDVPPIEITRKYLGELRSRLPRFPEQEAERLMREYNVNEKLARQLLDSEYADVFEVIVHETSVSPTVIAATLTETLKALKRDGVQIRKVSEDQLVQVFRLVDSEKTSKEAIPEIIAWLSEHEDAKPLHAIETLGLTMISEQELGSIIDELVEKNRKLVSEGGDRAFGFLMGAVMREYRGKVKPELASRIIREKLAERH